MPAEPGDAELARTLVAADDSGSLSTMSVEQAGFPFGSVASYAADGAGRPLLWLSDLAEHSRNLAADPRASLLVVEAGSGDPLALGRVTLLGEATVLAGTERAAALGDYRAAHPGSYTEDFHGFRMYRLDVVAVRYVGGFARMSWVEADDYAVAEADPVYPQAAGVIEHMNDDHADALVAYARVLGGHPDTVSARMTGVDRYGFGVLARGPDGTRADVRIGFDQAVTTPDEVRAAMIELLRRARAER
ncbi:MAG: HugZ family protein [Pseudonocardia sp.]